MQSGYIRADYDRPELHWHTVNGDTDLCGDGLTRLVKTRATPPASRPAGLTRPDCGHRSASSQRCRNESTYTGDGEQLGPEPRTSRHVT